MMEVYDCIVAQLEQIYMHNNDDQACPSCYLRDLHSLTRTSRVWSRAANATLYTKPLVFTNKEHGKLPKLNINGTSRLKLLRKTLRENVGLGRRVRELHVFDFQALYLNASIEREEIANAVASLVMACPSLERLVGFHTPFAHGFDRLSYALSTRTCLKERVWMLTDRKEEYGEYYGEDDEWLLRTGHFVREKSDPTDDFLDLNSKHRFLAALVLDQEPDPSSTPLNYRAVVGAFKGFPYLRNLSVSGLAETSFTNMALHAIPDNLQALRLEDLPGVTEKGIQRFAASPQAISIKKLALIDMGISSLVTVADILSPHFASLQRFTLVQDAAPTLDGARCMPQLRSHSLRYLHWELRCEASPLPALTLPASVNSSTWSPPFATTPEPLPCIATSLLADAIKSHALPSLTRIRIPHDPQGTIQALCKPLATALLPSDTAKFANALRPAPPNPITNAYTVHLDEPSTPATPWAKHFSYTIMSMSTGTLLRVDSKSTSPLSSAFSSASAASNSAAEAEFALTPLRSRLAAQSRILLARKEAKMRFCIFDPEGKKRLDKTVGDYVGRVGSKIEYCVRPDEGLGEQSEWITGIDDLLGDELVVVDAGHASSSSPSPPSFVRNRCGHVGDGRGGGKRRRRRLGVENLF
ncbi:cyclin domain F-box [Pyrenophora seminiperda CCB06]|uniref:Cyclin domain F-box n=1 Tax=Pyrenophora seminiperda CCB06 TaxID=1302712 RepID=A0A3M7MAL7_9PLEO|nr:cyclin domain F-box [Pyrenophora seminiperda CCB06]